MKEDGYTELICRGFCRYFKPDRETIQCGAYNLLRRHLSTEELEAHIAPYRGADLPLPDRDVDEEIRALACAACEFLVDGCDFREDRSGPPCGGYYIIGKLLKDRDSFLCA